MGLPPVEYVNLAADLGLRHVAIFLQSMPDNAYGYPAWSLRNDDGLRRDTKDALRDRDISISLADGFVVRKGVDIRGQARDIEIVAELGAPRINTVSFDLDLQRTLEQFEAVTGMAAAAGMDTTMEFGPAKPVPSLADAIEVVRKIDRPDFRLLIDTMHLFRSGATVTEVAALDPELIGYVQLCDVPLVPTNPDYMDEACFERMIPGTGELPLLEILSVLPRDVIIGLEVPLRSLANSGVGPRERLSRCIDATKNLLEQIDS
jgi:sugar phosphate isomerase/epimerase